jgi:hypothetical protein
MIALTTYQFSARAVALVAALAAAVCGLSSVALAEYPSFELKPTVVEYDVDPNWPQRPDHVSAAGWVSGLAIDDKDQVWIFKKGPDPVQVYASDGAFVRTWGKGMFSKPHQLRIDHEGNIWVADFGLHIVQKFTPEGKLLQTLGVRGEAGEDETHFNQPTDMAITPSGDIFVADGYGNRRIVHFDRGGKFIKAWGGPGSGAGEFVLPHAIVLGEGGRLYVADRNCGRIQIFDQEGKFVDQWSQVIMPWGLSIKGDNLWVCGSSPHWWMRGGKYPEYKDQIIMRFGTDGRARQLWTLPLGDIGTDKEHPNVSLLKPGHAVGIHCIDVDSKDNVYVGDIYGEHAMKLVPVTTRPAAELQAASAAATAASPK